MLAYIVTLFLPFNFYCIYIYASYQSIAIVPFRVSLRSINIHYNGLIIYSRKSYTARQLTKSTLENVNSWQKSKRIGLDYLTFNKHSKSVRSQTRIVDTRTAYTKCAGWRGGGVSACVLCHVRSNCDDVRETYIANDVSADVRAHNFAADAGEPLGRSPGNRCY